MTATLSGKGTSVTEFNNYVLGKGTDVAELTLELEGGIRRVLP